ncbi:hypothetical protein BDZ89DRAFT_1104046 [Hymenopellis radicata]|nr:hypothetical protein BDZ89DRAFT_1104046 [Hymenopellis radicata]
MAVLTHTNGVHVVNGAQTNGSSTHSVHKPSDDGFSTRAIHVGSEPSSETGAVIPAISLSTTFKQDAIGVHKGYEYSRSANPNRDALEAMLASIEAGGSDALAFASGSATTSTVLSSLGQGAHVISVNDVYGGTWRYMNRVAASVQGATVTSLDLESASEETILAAIQPNTKLVWIESPTNPTLRLIDIRAIADLVHSHPSNPLVLVDNTFLSPFYASPLLMGADLVLHSLTKYINGHSDVVMGALILPPHHKALTATLRFLQNAIGAVPSPYDSWLALRGAKTLALPEFLSTSPHVLSVTYPGLASHPRHDRAIDALSPHARTWISKLTPDKAGIPFGGMISFRIKGGEAAAEKFLTSTRLFTLAESLGGVESLAEHPARMTHGSVPEEERKKLGIEGDLIRLSVGVEEQEDLIEDIKRALDISSRL